MIRTIPRIIAAAIACALVAIAPARASQDTLELWTTGPHSMAAVAGRLNLSHQALATQNSGSSAPANGISGGTLAGWLWLDTSGTPYVWKMLDAPSGTWVTVGSLNASAHTFNIAIAQGGTGAATASAARTNLGLAIGTDVQAFDSDLGCLAGASTNGLHTRTGAGTCAERTVTGTANEITATNGDGVSGNPTLSLPSALTFTGKTVTGGSFSGPATSGVLDVQGAVKLSTESAPSQITSNQNNYNPSSVVCASSATLIITSDAARDITGMAGGVAGCEMAVINAGSFTITLKNESASSTAANRFGFGADAALATKNAATLRYEGTNSRWRLVGGPPATGAGSGTVTQVDTNNGLTGGPVTTSGTIGLATIATGKMLANTSGSTAVPSATSIPTFSHQEFTSSGTFTTPATGTTATVYRFRIQGGGGGGGGGNSGGVKGIGGGGGGYGEYYCTGVAASTGITVTVGAAGSAGASAGSGTAGGTSSIVCGATTVSCTGGGAGTSGAGAPIAGGTCTNAHLNVPGGSGESDATLNTVMGAVAGGDSSLGHGGKTNPSSGSGSAGIGFGGGGSGGFGALSGGAGAGGVVLVDWVL